MTLAPTITTRRGKQSKDRDLKKMADGTSNMGEQSPNVDEADKEITIKDLYRLTLSLKTNLTSDIDVEKQKTDELEDENAKLLKEVKEQGKVIEKLTDRVRACEASTEFQRLLIEENRDDIALNDAKTRRHNLIIYGVPE